MSHTQQSQCNYFTVHGFQNAVYDVAEDARLETEFALNVVGTTQFSKLVVSGTITLEADGTASKWHLVK